MCGSSSPASHSELNLHRENKGAVVSRTITNNMWIKNPPNVLDQVMEGRYLVEETEGEFEGVMALREKPGLVEFDVIWTHKIT